MRRFLILSFGILSYGMFGLVFLYLIAFLGNLQNTGLAETLPWLKDIIPRSVDFGGPVTDTWMAAAINIAIIVVFGVQHTPMARQGFKKWWTGIIPVEAERSMYVFASNVVMIGLYYFWRPMPTVIWQAESTWSVILMWGVMAGGFGLLFASTFLIDHMHLLGMKQVWQQFARKQLTNPTFTSSTLYRLVRHPINLGWIIGFWGGPTMTVGHLLLAAGMTIYVLIAIPYEERDLVKFHPDYDQYRKEVPALVPIPGRRRAS